MVATTVVVHCSVGTNNPVTVILAGSPVSSSPRQPPMHGIPARTTQFGQQEFGNSGSLQ